jgi:hypothetical protein
MMCAPLFPSHSNAQLSSSPSFDFIENSLFSTAKQMVHHAFARNPKFQVYFTFEGWMLSNLTAGMSPVSDLGDAVSQVALSGLFRFISLFYLNDFWRIVRQHADKEDTLKKNKEETKTD